MSVCANTELACCAEIFSDDGVCNEPEECYCDDGSRGSRQECSSRGAQYTCDDAVDNPYVRAVPGHARDHRNAAERMGRGLRVRSILAAERTAEDGRIRALCSRGRRGRRGLPHHCERRMRGRVRLGQSTVRFQLFGKNESIFTS